MGRRKKMENIENKDANIEEVVNNIGGVETVEINQEYNTTTTVCSTTTLYPKRNVLYQIFFGDDADEYYTWVTPIFDAEQVHLSALIKKGVITEDLYDNIVEISYREDLDEENSFITKDLKNGIVIKVIDHIGLDWLNKDYITAQNELKEESLNAYRKLLPQLFHRLEAMENRRINNNSNNGLIEL